MIASEPKCFAFSRFKFVGKSHICWGDSPEPPGYPSGAHASWGNSPAPPPPRLTLVGLMQLR